MRTGIVWYTGIPGSGKTTRAVKDAETSSLLTGRPILVVDPGIDAQFDRWNCQDLVGCISEIWQYGRHACFRPSSDEEADAMFRAIQAGGSVVVIVEEAHSYLTNRYISEPLQRLMRSHRHSDVLLLLTTQRIGDIAQDAFGQAPHLYIGRQASPRDLDRLERDFGISADKVRQIPQWEFIHVHQGFDAHRNEESVDAEKTEKMEEEKAREDKAKD